MKFKQIPKHLLTFFCVISPISLFFPWTIVPGNLGLAYVNFDFFIHWLTKYPDFGPVNLKVMLGIICKFLLSTIPIIFVIGLNFFFLQFKKLLMIVLCFTLVMVYLPVLVNLDFALWLSAIFGVNGLPGIFKHFDYYSIKPMIGPMIHILSVFSTLILAYRAYKIKLDDGRDHPDSNG